MALNNALVLRLPATLIGAALLAVGACSPSQHDGGSRLALLREAAEVDASQVWVEQGDFSLEDRASQLIGPMVLDGNVAIVGAESGVHAFERVREAWQEIEPILLPGPLDHARSIAASDGTLALLVETFSENVGGSVELWLCQLDQQTWSVERVATDTDLASADMLALSDSWLVLSVAGAEGGRDVLAFARAAEGLAEPILVYAGGPDDELSLAVSGSDVLIALPHELAPSGSEGIVRAYSRAKSSWQVSATLSAVEPDAVSFGRVLAATPRRVIAGTATGPAYVFEREKSGFSPPARLDPPDDVPGTVHSVAVNDVAAIVGLPQLEVDSVPGAGAAYMAFSVASHWSGSSWLARDHVRQAAFGHEVALSDNQALVTAPDDQRASAGGRVFAYGACTSDDDCSVGRYCSARGTCTLQKRLTDACDATLDCSEPGCRVCESNHCVDGYCCDSACDAQCQACGEPGSEGACRAVSGGVRGDRDPCQGDASDCTGICDGKNPACSYAAPQTPCASSCQAGVATPSTCDGAGVCARSSAYACAGYACDGDACGVTCRRPEDCVDGFACLERACVPVSPLACSEDGKTSRGPTGTSYCAPYRCDEARGVCRTQCEVAADCDDGYVCDARRRACVVESEAPPADAGCGCRLGRAPGSAATSASAWLALACWLLKKSRRQRHR